MAFAIYKRGQGYWTRVLSAAGAGALVVVFAAYLQNQLSVLDESYRVYVQNGVPALFILICGAVLFWVFNKASIVDFLIATDAEMRKVNWPTRREVVGSTIVVIGGTLLMALLLFVVDIVFLRLFQGIGIITTGT